VITVVGMDPGPHTGLVKLACLQVVQHMNFNRGNAVKYLWRAGAKGNEIEDLQKARQYVQFELARLGDKSSVIVTRDQVAAVLEGLPVDVNGVIRELFEPVES